MALQDAAKAAAKQAAVAAQQASKHAARAKQLDVCAQRSSIGACV